MSFILQSRWKNLLGKIQITLPPQWDQRLPVWSLHLQCFLGFLPCIVSPALTSSLENAAMWLPNTDTQKRLDFEYQVVKKNREEEVINSIFSEEAKMLFLPMFYLSTWIKCIHSFRTSRVVPMCLFLYWLLEISEWRGKRRTLLSCDELHLAGDMKLRIRIRVTIRISISWAIDTCQLHF